MPRFKHRPIEVEAWHFTEDTKDQVVNDLVGNVYPVWNNDGRLALKVTTIHGDQAFVQVGNCVVADAKPGTYYPVKPDIFEATYEAI